MRSDRAPKPLQNLDSCHTAPHNPPAHKNATAGSVLVGAVVLGDNPYAFGLHAQADDLALGLLADLLAKLADRHVVSALAQQIFKRQASHSQTGSSRTTGV